MKLREWVKWAAAVLAVVCLTANVGFILATVDNRQGKEFSKEPPAVALQKSDRLLLDVPHLPQGENYPAGCESVSAVMALRYLGANLSVEYFIDECLDQGSLSVSNGVTYGPDPKDCFIGSPYSSKGYGCYAPAIANAAQKLESQTGIHAEAVSGVDLASLAEENIEQGRPVLIWATGRMKPSKEGTSWIIRGTDELFIWPSGEHCLVLIGYDSDYYYFNDPLRPSGGTAYPKALVEERYHELGRQAVVFSK